MNSLHDEHLIFDVIIHILDKNTSKYLKRLNAAYSKQRFHFDNHNLPHHRYPSNHVQTTQSSAPSLPPPSY